MFRWFRRKKQETVDEAIRSVGFEPATQDFGLSEYLYMVSLYECPEAVGAPIYFECQAGDDQLAAEQAQDAYPGCEILCVYPIAEILASSA